MKPHYLALIVAFIALVAGLFLLQQSDPVPDSEIPTLDTTIADLANYRETLINYANVTRPDNRTRDIYINPGAPRQIANNSTARLPNGTVIVIEAHSVRSVPGSGNERMGLADNIHVAVKSDNWTPADYQTSERAGDWNYFSFDPQTGRMSDESTFECFDCHGNNSQIDFIFSRELIADYGKTTEVQTSFCNLPNRIPCRF